MQAALAEWGVDLTALSYNTAIKSTAIKSEAAIGAAVEEFSPGLLKSLLRTNKTQTFVWEPGRTADRSAALSG
jgi:hypothetical protein